MKTTSHTTARAKLRNSSYIVAALILLISANLADAELITNGGFEQGLAGWTTNGHQFGMTVSMTTNSFEGTWAAYVAGRKASTNGVAQDVTGSLLAVGTGTQHVLRFWIRVDGPSVARVSLLVRATGTTNTQLLAERVVHQTGTWVCVRGSRTINWIGNLLSATLYFDVGRPYEFGFPSFTMDSVTLQPDADGDWVPDSEEPSAQAVTDRDIDHDGMNDDWEIDYGFDPLDAADRDLDRDLDGYSNYQEYMAASNPTNSAAVPGIPADPYANGPTRAILRYLALLPSSPTGRTVVGQHVTITAPEYSNFVVRLKNDTTKWPGLVEFQYDAPVGSVPFQITNVNPYAIEAWTNGSLVAIKWSPFNPWTLGGRNDTNLVVMTNVLAAGTAAHDQFVNWLDVIADGLDELQKAGIVVLWRPLSEMNGAWFWWGKRNYADYIGLWRLVFNHLTYNRGIHNLLWVYESDASVHPFIPADFYYPGDDVVDVMGHNFYDDDWILPFASQRLFREYPKVYAFPQAGSDTNRDGSWDNMTIVDMITSNYNRCSFFDTWNSFSNGSGYQVRAIVDATHATELMTNAWMVTLDELNWKDDGDADSLPDWWEVANFGSVTNADAETDGDNDHFTAAEEFNAATSPHDPDTDHDNIPDGEEYNADTNPLDALSSLALAVMSESNGVLTFVWTGGRDATQNLQFRHSDDPGNQWYTAVSNPPPTSRTGTFSVAVAGSNVVFRIAAERAGE